MGPEGRAQSPPPGSCPTPTSTPTASGSTTTAGSRPSSLSSRPSAWPSPKPTPGQNAGPGPLPAKPANPAHNNVDTARLTCGRHLGQVTESQLTAKCEDLAGRSSRFTSVHVHVWH